MLLLVVNLRGGSGRGNTNPKGNIVRWEQGGVCYGRRCRQRWKGRCEKRYK